MYRLLPYILSFLLLSDIHTMRYICMSSEQYPSDQRAVCFSPDYEREVLKSENIPITQGLYFRSEVHVPPDTKDEDAITMINNQLKTRVIEAHIKNSNSGMLEAFYLRNVRFYFIPDFKVKIFN